jgi:hypothetical protein
VSALRPEDQALCVEYVDGELDEAAQLEFERRLAHEPELALAVERLLATDRVLREQLLAPTAARRRPWSLAVRLVASIAAAAVLFVGSLLYFARERSRVAFVASHESPLEALASAPELRLLRPEGLSALRGSQDPPNISAEDFLRTEAAAREREANSALKSAVSSGEAGFFRIALELDEASLVYVHATTRDNKPVVLEPGPLRLSAGRHELPGPRFSVDPNQPGVLRYDRGYLVPVGCGELTVVLAILAPGHELQHWPDTSELSGQPRELGGQGAEVHTLVVREPR